MLAGVLFCASSADKGDGPVPGVLVRFAALALASCALPCMQVLSVSLFGCAGGIFESLKQDKPTCNDPCGVELGNGAKNVEIERCPGVDVELLFVVILTALVRLHCAMLATKQRCVSVALESSRQLSEMQHRCEPTYASVFCDRSTPQHISRALVESTCTRHLLNDHSLLPNVERSLSPTSCERRHFSNCFEHFSMALCMAVNTVKADSR